MLIKKSSFLVLMGLLVALPAAAQTAPEKALETVQDKLDNLVQIKDENKTPDLAFRVDAFAKVVEFSQFELKDLRVKLLALDLKKEPEIAVWQEKALSQIELLTEFLDEMEQAVDVEDLSLTDITALAKDFKVWRDANYLPLVGAVGDYILITQQTRAIDTATKRADKIEADLVKLKKARFKTADLERLLEKARAFIDEASNLNSQNREMFLAAIAPPVPKLTAAENASSTTSASSSLPSPFPVTSSSETSPETTPALLNIASTTAGATATSSVATSTDPTQPVSSIRDLVKDSLINIKKSYQIFIEMSDLVRKLLN